MNSPVSIARLFSEDYGYGDSGGADYGYGDSGGADYGVRYPLFAVFVNRCQCSELTQFFSLHCCLQYGDSGQSGADYGYGDSGQPDGKI